MASESPRIAELRRRVESDPSSIAFAQLAEEYRRAGQYEAAEACCRTGLVRHPAYLSARVTLGRTLIELNKLEEAEQELEQVLNTAPDNLAAIRGIAEIHQRVGRLDAALEYYRRALALAQHDPELEEIVAKLKRDLVPPTPIPVPIPTPPAQSLTDFDELLDSLGITARSAPTLVEALLKDRPQSAASEPESAVLEASLDDSSLTELQAPLAPEPDWMVGPLPSIVAPVDVSEPCVSASDLEESPVSPGQSVPIAPTEPVALIAPDRLETSTEPVAPLPPDAADVLTAPAAAVAPDAPENSTEPAALIAPDAPDVPDAPEARTEPVAVITPDAPEAGTEPVAPVSPDAADESAAHRDVAERDRLILDELEAWLAAIKR